LLKLLTNDISVYLNPKGEMVGELKRKLYLGHASGKQLLDIGFVDEEIERSASIAQVLGEIGVVKDLIVALVSFHVAAVLNTQESLRDLQAMFGDCLEERVRPGRDIESPITIKSRSSPYLSRPFPSTQSASIPTSPWRASMLLPHRMWVVKRMKSKFPGLKDAM
jgi:hypothetical protein